MLNWQYCPQFAHIQCKMGVTIKEKPVTPDGTHFREFVNYGAWEAYLRRMAMDSEWGDWIALWGLVKTVTMNICVIDEDCVIGRWYNLDFELMSLCPQFFFVCETSLSFFLCSLAVFVFMKFALWSTIVRNFFVCLRCAKLVSIYAYKWKQILCNYVSGGTNRSHALIKTYLYCYIGTITQQLVKLTHFLFPTPAPPPPPSWGEGRQQERAPSTATPSIVIGKVRF